MTHFTSNTNQNNNIIQESRRETFLQRFLIIAAVPGVIAVIAGVLTTDNSILQGIYIGVFITLVAIIVTRPPYLIKAGVFVVLPFILGISSMTNAGMRGDSMFFFLAFVTFSALLIGPRISFIAIGLSEFVIITMGYITLNGYYTPLDPLAGTSTLANWTTDSVLHLLISLVVLVGLRMLHENFNQAQEQNKMMVIALRDSQLELENRVETRTKELARKTDQLSASAYVARQTAEIQELDNLLINTVNLIANQFDLYHVGIYLVNERGDYAILQAASSEGGKQLLERGHRLDIGLQGMIGFSAAERKPQLVLDVNEDAAFRSIPELPDTRSELSLPLAVRNNVLGVLDLQSSDAQAFQYEDIEIFQTLADQIAVAVENVRLLSENRLAISQLEIASGIEVRQNWQTASSAQTPAYHYSATGLRQAAKSALTKGKNVLEVPLILRGQKIGKISLRRKDEFNNWTPQEETVANELATQTALALDNIRLVEHTRQRAEREHALASIANHIRETLDLDMVLRTSAREIQSTMSLQEVEVRLVPPDLQAESKDAQQATSP